MEPPDLNNIGDGEILICLNCWDVNVASENFKYNGHGGISPQEPFGYCDKCSSKAFEVFGNEHYFLKIMRKVLLERR